MSEISLCNVSKHYSQGRGDPLSVLEEISLKIDAGSFVAIMGPSGSGKTTLLNLIGGLDRPTHGELTVGGKSIQNMSQGALAKWRSRTIGFVFQFYNLLPVLSAQKNVELPLLLTKLNGKQRKANATTALEIVGLADRAKHTPAKLSGGQQQRVAIARAIVADPEILVCDEPTGDLDRNTADEILGLLQVLNQEHKKTVVMVTHDPRAAAFANRTIYLDKGKLSTVSDSNGGQAG